MPESNVNTDKPSCDAVLAYGILRATFGVNIMLHGVSRLLAGTAGFLAYLNHYFEKTPLMPTAMLPVFAAVLPWAEGFFGLLLLLGLGTRFAIVGGSAVMAMLVFGTNMAQDWNIAGLQLIYVFIYYYLLVHRERLNGYSVDSLIGTKR